MVKKPVPKLSQLARLIVKAGEANYGTEWRRRLAEASGVSPAMLAFVATGEKPASPAVARKVATAIGKTAGALKKIETEILANIGDAK